jgi:hypothetical protein
MSGSVKDEAQTVSLISMIEQCKSVLRAGGTVYLGETHDQAHARQVCVAALEAGCVQYLCVEYDTSVQDDTDTSEDLIKKMGALDGITNFRTNRKDAELTMVAVARKAAADNGCKIVFIDNTQGYSGGKVTSTVPRKRQIHMKNQIQKCRAKVNMIGRGVLVVVGSDHLVTIGDKKNAWHALHELVYDGHTFVFGRYETCYMVWQLS